jgi:CRISPR-associated protein Cmr4
MNANLLKPRIYYLHALTPLHIGTGRGEGFIDLPLLREKSTGLPCVPGSAIKGVLRYEHTSPPEPGNDESPSNGQESKPLTAADSVFGKEPKGGGESDFSGLLRVGDAHLLCLPVRSWQAVFAWVTCPFVLRRYRGDWRDAGGEVVGLDVPSIRDDGEALGGDDNRVAWHNDTVYLEDLSLTYRREPLVTAWTRHLSGQLFQESDRADWQNEFSGRFLIVSDTLFAFLAQHHTEVRPHVKLGENRTVADGPWYEESLPAESLLWGIVAQDVFRWQSQQADNASVGQLLEKIMKTSQRLQIGGNATTGLGQVLWVCGDGQ